MTSERARRVAFLMSKDPVHESGGDVEMSLLAMTIAAEHFDVSVICLSSEPGAPTRGYVLGGLPVTRVPKPRVNPLALAYGSLRANHSLVHVRFDSQELRAAIDGSDADVFVAEHSYMAESFLGSAHAGTKRLVVNTHVSEAYVWRATRGLLGRIEGRRLLRDELRVARRADAVGVFDAEEAQYYRRNGVSETRWLDITLPPGRQVDLSGSAPRLILLGTRAWAPNQEAFEVALKLWPRIAGGIEDAELIVVGARAPGESVREYPRGVRDLGFVEDLEALLRTCRAMIAPIRTGGGVRVKLLEAARLGLPFVGTDAAVGSMAQVLGLTGCADDDEFVNRCRGLLVDRRDAVRSGSILYEANVAHWRRGFPQRALREFIEASSPP